jgi:hypothetical protein
MTTELEFLSALQEGGCDPDELIKKEDIILPVIIRKRLGSPSDGPHKPSVSPSPYYRITLQNWEQGRTLMDRSARPSMTFSPEPEAALRALGQQYRS